MNVLPHPTASAPPACRSRVLWWMGAADRRHFFSDRDDEIGRLGAAVRDLQETDGADAGLRAVNPEVLVTSWSTPPLPVDWLDAADCRLRYVCHVGGTVRRLLPRRFLEHGGLVTNWGEAVAASVAEHALLLALAALRELPAWSQGKAGVGSGPRTRTLRGKRVAIHGFGGVARALVGLLQPFQVELWAYSAGVPASVFAAHGAKPAASLEELLGLGEVFFECEALTPATTRVLTAARLALLPEGAVFVNVGRGRLLDEAALLAEARSGRLRVAVDVLENEPITAASALCQVPGAIVSPHIGGPTFEERAAIGRRASDNVQRYLRGEPLEGIVTPAIYDRST